MTTTHTPNLDEKMLDSANNNQVDDDFVLDDDTGFGQRLRQAREQQNLSIDEAANAMFLDQNIIVALETEAFSELPPPIYVQGYLRNYSKLLKLPFDKVLSSYKQISGDQNHPRLGPETSGQSRLRRQQNKANRSSKSHPLLVVFLIICLVVVSAWQLINRLDTQTLKDFFSFADTEEFITPPLLNSDGEVITDLLLPLPEYSQNEDIDLGSPLIDNNTDNSDIETPAIDKALETTTEIEVESNTAIQDTSETVASLDNTTSDVKTAETVATETPSDVTEVINKTPDNAVVDGTTATPELINNPTNIPWIVLQFKGESWTTIKDSKGKRLYYGTSKANETATIYEGTPPFRLVLGKSNEVDIEYRGQAVDLSRYKGGVARLKLGKAAE